MYVMQDIKIAIGYKVTLIYLVGINNTESDSNFHVCKKLNSHVR